MSTNTAIEWCDATWNPVVGCTKVSLGCKGCWAERIHPRIFGSGPGSRPFSQVRTLPHKLDIPLHWRKPRRIFVASMGDLFHEAVADQFIDQVLAVAALCPQHTFQLLTKRTDRLPDYIREAGKRIFKNIDIVAKAHKIPRWKYISTPYYKADWPLANVHLGVSVENQATADERIPLLLQTPAAVRYVSYEPALSQVDIDPYLWYAKPTTLRNPSLAWVIVGGESGPKRRYCDNAWVRDVVGQCKNAGVPVFVKQLHVTEGHSKRGFRVSHDPAEWPEDLRVRQLPGDGLLLHVPDEVR